MVFNSPGIYWDDREPIPPAVRGQLELEQSIARWQHREPRDFARVIQDENLPHRPRFEVREAEIHLDREPAVEPAAQPQGHGAAAIANFTDDGFLPPLSASVKAQLIQDTAKVTVTQLFANESNVVIPKTSYTFPLPQGCTVTDFVCRFGSNKILRGKIKPKEDAFDTFNNATRQGQPAALLDQNTTEMFTTALGNIPANCRLKAEISFILLLPYKFNSGEGLTTFTLPLYIAPRFGTPSPSLQEALRSSTNLRSLQIEVDILAPENINSVSCETHAVRVEMGVGSRTCQTWQEFVESGEREVHKSALITLEQTETQLDRDFVLEIRTKPEDGLEQPQACVESHPELPHHRAVMLTIPPNLMLRNNEAVNNTTNGEIVFVADRSGSMSDKIVALKSAMQFFLKGIPRGRHFNVWCFGDRFEHLWPRSQLYSQQSLQNALEYVAWDFRSDMGGTELLPALRAVIAAGSGYQTMDIVTLTDGQVWDLKETLDFVEKTRKLTEGRVRFFCLGIGAAVSHALVEGIAKLGGGYAEVIPLASQGGWESRVVAVLKAALTDHTGIIDIEMDGQAEVDGPTTGIVRPSEDDSTNYLNPAKKLMQSPVQAFTLSPFLRNRVFMLFESLDPPFPIERIQLQAKRPGSEQVSIWIPIKTLNLPGTTVHKLAARALLGDLERGQSHIHLGPNAPPPNSSQERAMVKKEGERLGCKWSLVSQWTSFVGVEESFSETEDNQDPYMDGGEFAVQVVPGDDLDLLRPRGTQGNHAFTGLLEHGSGAPNSEDSNRSESEESDTEGWRLHYGTGSRNDDDNDDGSDGPGGPGGPAHGAGANTGRDLGGRSYQGPYQGSQTGNGRSNAGHPGAVDTWGGAQNTYNQVSQDDLISWWSSVMSSLWSPPSSTSDPQMQNGLAPTASRQSQSSSLWAQEVTPEGTLRPQTVADTPPMPPFSFPEIPVLATGVISSNLQESSATTPIQRTEGDRPDTKNFRVSPSFSTSSEYKQSKDGTETNTSIGLDHDPWDSYIPLMDKPAASIYTPTSFMGAHKKDSKQNLDKKADSYMPLMDKPAASIYTPTSFMGAHKKDSKQNLDKKADPFLRRRKAPASEASTLSSAISAPHFNLPAASAMMETPSLQAKSTDDKAKEAFIGELLTYQLHDGSFSIPDSGVVSLLGQPFSNAIRALTNLIEPKYELWGHSEIPKLAFAAAIIAVLEDQLTSKKTLWELMAQKARDFISGLLWDVGSIIQDAKDQLLGIQLTWNVTVAPHAAGLTSVRSSPLGVGNDAVTRAFAQAIRRITGSKVEGSYSQCPPSDANRDSDPPWILGKLKAPSKRMALVDAPGSTAGDHASQASASIEGSARDPQQAPGSEEEPPTRRRSSRSFSSFLSRLSTTKPKSKTSLPSLRAGLSSRLRPPDPATNKTPTAQTLAPPPPPTQRSPVVPALTSKATRDVPWIPPPPSPMSIDE
ncbi:hypothetical protein DL764_009355 [Monosporascus ibericus]|uniref:VWFA domain-containing protein n=1 Tax=Monosporascus ibericus TaxID=155417 RepID=A0A4Q4SY99_9PEZI|nr:hypothetical protein DL764_009355 [Monosporascus ibericus]